MVSLIFIFRFNVNTDEDKTKAFFLPVYDFSLQKNEFRRVSCHVSEQILNEN